MQANTQCALKQDCRKSKAILVGLRSCRWEVWRITSRRGREKKKKQRKKKEEQKTKTKKDRFEVTMSVEIITFKKLGFLSRLLGLFFFSSSPLDEQCSNLSLENPNLKNRSQNSPKRRREKQRLARRKHWNRMQAADRPRPDAPSRTQTIFGKVLYSHGLSRCWKWLSLAVGLRMMNLENLECTAFYYFFFAHHVK